MVSFPAPPLRTLSAALPVSVSSNWVPVTFSISESVSAPALPVTSPVARSAEIPPPAMSE